MITWEESDMFCFIGDNGFIDSSPDLDYTLAEGKPSSLKHNIQFL